MLDRPRSLLSFLHFSRNQRTALLALVLISVVGTLSPYWMPLVWEKEPINTTLTEEQIAAMEDWIARSEALEDSIRRAREAKYASFRQNRWDNDKPRSTRTNWRQRSAERKAERQRAALAVDIDLSVPLPAPGSLNPNTADSTQLKRIGVPIKIVQRWYKFRAAGATFVRRQDIAKLYGLPDSTYNRIAPFFLNDQALKESLEGSKPVSPSEEQNRKFASSQVDEPDVLVEVNTATAEDLVAVRGIGPYYAKRILEYRDKLGGFTSMTQVAQTPGFREDAFDKFAASLTVDPAELKLLAINHLTVRQLVKHPYINWEDAEVIVANRRNHGPYKTLDDLYATIAVDSATVERLAPYLTFD